MIVKTKFVFSSDKKPVSLRWTWNRCCSSPPSVYAISNALVAETEEVFNDRCLSDFLSVFGHRDDHDLDLSISASPAQPLTSPCRQAIRYSA